MTLFGNYPRHSVFFGEIIGWWFVWWAMSYPLSDLYTLNHLIFLCHLLQTLLRSLGFFLLLFKYCCTLPIMHTRTNYSSNVLFCVGPLGLWPFTWAVSWSWLLNVGVHPECGCISLYAVPAIAWGDPSGDPHPMAPQSLDIWPANQWLEGWCSGEWRERRGRDKEETEGYYRGDSSVRRAPALA